MNNKYWKMFREMLHIMSGETKLTAVDAAGLASGGIRMEGVGENNSRLILTLQIEEEE